ncbi:hypothetical protein BGZ83_011712 [Gryganskiella cystojenkinii]|nr:hypothetical protein BGZ83_011712 [Gryganskiella cystojenkinii]
MHQFQSFGPQGPTVAEYAFPSVLQYLQSEWRRFERDRNEWDIEKAEMKARIAFLEGEKRGVDNTKMDLMKRVKMLEYALRQERSKYLESSAALTAGAGAAKGIAPTPSPKDAATGGNNDNAIANMKAQNRMSTYSITSNNMAQVSPSTATSLDPVGRAKSRDCLQEISYLTASVPPSVTAAMPPAQHRLGRQEYDRRAMGPNGIRGAGAKNRHSDFFPANVSPVAVPPSLARSNSVPISTLQSLSHIKPTSSSPPLEADPVNMNGATVSDTTISKEEDDQSTPQARARTIDDEAVHKPLRNRQDSVTGKVEQGKNNNNSNHSNSNSTGAVLEEVEEDVEQDDKPNGLEAFQREEAITVVHSPISGEQWQADLRKAGQELAQSVQGKKGSLTKAEDEAQLSKDVQDKFKISPDRINKMVKDWDKLKQETNPEKNSMRKKKGKDEGVLDELANLNVSETEIVESNGGTKEGDSGADEPARWRPRVTLRRHMDTVRSIAFHPTHKSLLSGSEDGMLKYWNLESSLRESKRPPNAEIEPIHTYRGHTKPVTAVAISADQNKCFSASMDSTVRSWKLVPMNKETYARLDPTLSLSSFIGHTDSVWDIRLFPISISSSQLLASISADGALKIWDTETKGSPLRSSWGYHGLEASELAEPTEAYTSGLAKLPVPTSLDFCPTDLKKMVVSYSNSVIKLFDIETGKEILAFKSNETYDGTTSTQINKVVCHPTMPVVVSGHEDRYIRFFDINSGSCSFSMLSHLDAVSSLDIDPAGLVLCSGGHDGSVRLWDLAVSTRPCLQEFTGHRRKSNEGVTSVKYHPTLPGLLATGGADSIVKVYTRS